MFKIKQSERHKIGKFNFFLIQYFNVLALVIILVVLVIGYSYFIKPKYNAIRQGVQTATEAASAEYRIYTDYYAKLREYTFSHDRIAQDDKDRIAVMLPDNPKHEDLFIYLEKIIEDEYHLPLSSIEIIPDSNKTKDTANRSKSVIKTGPEDDNSLPPRIGTVDISMEIEGITYFELKNLLATMENSLRLMDIKELDYDPEGKSLKLKISTYYFKEIKSISPPVL